MIGLKIILFVAILALPFGIVIAQDTIVSGQSADTLTPAPPPPELPEVPQSEIPESPPVEEQQQTPPPSTVQQPKPQQPSDGIEGTGLDDDGLFEDALPAAGQPAQEQGQKKATGQRKVSIDAVVVVNYKFSSTPETYSVKYHINMGGEANADVSMIKGGAKIATDISGFLAKSSAFECLLKVSIADVPYEIMFKKVSETEADLNVAFKGQILEDWESLCTFLDASGAKFNTRGSPERWIGVALEKAKPPLTNLTAPLDPTKTTTLKFIIPKHTVEDEGLGKAEIDGTGVVTIQPTVVGPPAEANSENGAER